MRRVAPILALGAIALVVGLRVLAGQQQLALVLVPQGISAETIEGARVFLLREGTLSVTAFASRSPQGDSLVWCPHDRLFVSPAQKEVFDAQGRYVAGPATRDMDRYDVRIDDEHLVHVDTRDVRRAKARSDGQISGEAFAKYESWSNDPSKPVGFCQDPVR